MLEALILKELLDVIFQLVCKIPHTGIVLISCNKLVGIYGCETCLTLSYSTHAFISQLILLLVPFQGDISNQFNYFASLASSLLPFP